MNLLCILLVLGGCKKKTEDLSDEVLIVDIENLERVAIYKGRNPNYIITVTLTPSPLPVSETVTLEISTKSGNGSAIFEDGSNIKMISETSVVEIRGVTNSDQKDNIAIDAIYKGSVISTERFSVRTYPVNIVKKVGRDDGNGIIYFEYEWESESGSVNDLLDQGLLYGEIVEYTGDGENIIYQGNPCFRPFSPPYSGDFVTNPYIKNQLIQGARFHDTHSPDSFTPFKEPYVSNVFIGKQHYRFRDPLLMEESTYENLLGPLFIKRNVFLDNGEWKFRIEKDGVISELILPSSGPLWIATADYYSETANLDSIVTDLYGPNYRVADWNNLVSYSQTHNIVAWADSIGMLNGYPYGFLVTRNGQHFWSGIRHYWIDRHDGVVPSGWLVHASIYNHFIDLGSWYSMSLRILCIRIN